jgi:protein phosphatase 1L
VLAVSRAFGDRLLKRYVVATPDITEETVGPDDQLVVLASDGLWDVVSNDDAINLIKDVKVQPKALSFSACNLFVQGSHLSGAIGDKVLQ